MSSLHERVRSAEEVAARVNQVVVAQGGFLRLKIERAVDVGEFDGLVPEGQCQALENCVHGHWFSEGEAYVTFGRGHMHADCLESVANKSSRLDFLLMLATHVARTPSQHNAGTIRQVINGLVRALAATQGEADQKVANAYAQGARDAAEAIAESAD